jgi:hypothetical protein
MTTPIELQVAPGFRFLKDLYPESRGMGLSYYPYSSIYSGLVPSWTATAGNLSTPPAQTVSISAGSAYLDSQLSTLASSVDITVPTTSAAVGDNYYYIILNPSRRVVPYVGSTKPSTLLNGDSVTEGDWAVQCADLDEYLIANSFFKRVGSSWQQSISNDPINDLIFQAPIVPSQKGKNRHWGNQVASKVTASNFQVNIVEKRVYIGSVYPPYVNSNSLALLRDCASLHIATLVINFNEGTGTARTLNTDKSYLTVVNNVKNP